jgi:NAD(P)H-hydrate epimerase
MKILSIEDIRKADEYTIKNEPIASIDLMERAASKCCDFILEMFSTYNSFVIFAGIGNNGGDGLVIARKLVENGKNVKIFICEFSQNFSTDFITNLNRLPENIEILKIQHYNDIDKLKILNNDDVIIDALLGSGITRAPDGWLAELIKYVNDLNNIKIAIDMPSGLFADKTSKDHLDRVFRVNYTLAFELPRLAFFMPENYDYVGEWKILPIGLDHNFINNCEPLAIMIDESEISKRLKKRNKFGHKNSFGHACIAAGSPGKYGAELLATLGALKSGAGLVSTIVPVKLLSAYLSKLPEALTIPIDTAIIEDLSFMNNYDAACIGPGIGTDDFTANALLDYMINCETPTVLDADAINILSKHKDWYEFLNNNFILTPHPGELKRLIGQWNDDFEKLVMVQNFCKQYKCTIILKEHNSKIINGDGQIFINITGDDTLSKGGSGDILSGLLTGLLAQHYSPIDASIIATCLHGAAGEWCGNKYSHHATNISQLAKGIEKVFISWEHNDFSQIKDNFVR